MTPEEIRKLINLDTENEHVEFKQSLLGRTEITEYSVAIGNEGGGYLVCGVTNQKPRIITGVGSVTNDELQQIRRAVLDGGGIRIEPDIVAICDKNVLVVKIPSRLPGQLFHTKTGKYLMRSGEDLRGMTPVELSAIILEVTSVKSGNPVIQQLSELATSHGKVNIQPIIPGNPYKGDFLVRSVDELRVEIQKLSSGDNIAIPTASIVKVLWAAHNQPPTLKLSGRLQKLTVSNEWQYFDDTPQNDLERQFGFSKNTVYGDRRVQEVTQILTSMGCTLHWINASGIGSAMASGYEIIYDNDGRYFTTIPHRTGNQILGYKRG